MHSGVFVGYVVRDCRVDAAAASGRWTIQCTKRNKPCGVLDIYPVRLSDDGYAVGVYSGAVAGSYVELSGSQRRAAAKFVRKMYARVPGGRMVRGRSVCIA